MQGLHRIALAGGVDQVGQQFGIAVAFEVVVPFGQGFAQRGAGLQRAVQHHGHAGGAVEVGLRAVAQLGQGLLQGLRAGAARGPGVA